MTVLATIRQQQHARGRSVLGLLLLMWLGIALQACVVAAPTADWPVDQTVHTELHDDGAMHSNHVAARHCSHCLDCEHEGCADNSECDRLVAVSTKSAFKLPDNGEPGLVVAAAFSRDRHSARINNRANEPLHQELVAPTAPLTIRHCVYLI